jgi:hypothetical protein
MNSPLDRTDPRWQLTLRVLHSSLFEKAPRLRSFLQFICEKELTGHRPEINEHAIGVQVFGRPDAYNPGEDSIVRSQARFLRQRLEEYFRSEGLQEPLHITIPKGSYVPVFEPALPPFAGATVAASAVGVQPSPAETPDESRAISPSEGKAVPSTTRKQRVWPWAAAAMVLVALTLLVLAFVRQPSKRLPGPERRFWSTIFDPHRNLLIVPADSTLILIEELTGRPVSLQSYLNRKYLDDLVLPKDLTTLTSSDLDGSHYTSMADLNLVARIVRVPFMQQSHSEIRYARDMSITDAKEDNLVLIGGPRANPWVELFAAHMNFYVDFDWKTRQNFVLDKAPRVGEQPLYTEGVKNGIARVYGLIAFQPSLDGEGDVLLVAGTSSAGTQTAADFLLNGRTFDEFLRKIQQPDGHIPHFEVLLEGRDLGGNVPQPAVVAYRLMP